jgi:hypothetical protein
MCPLIARGWPITIALFFASIHSTSVHAETRPPDYVLQHAPVFISRWDQILNRKTDRLLALAYSIIPKSDGSMLVRYTTYFSDEDSKINKRQTSAQMGRYGRRLDIEWAYEVLVDPVTGEGRNRNYHCDVIVGIGHKKCRFNGRYFNGSSRPVLYNNARHNIFGDRPEFPYGSRKGYVIAMEPSLEIEFPKSRDMIPIEHPEMLRSSDEELARERKLGHPSTEYLYLRIRGKLQGHAYFSVTNASGKVFVNGTTAEESLKEMGLDLWGSESVVAILIPEKDREAMKFGTESFQVNALIPLATLDVEDLGAYLVEKGPDGRYQSLDLTSQIRCDDLSKFSFCRLN